MLGLPFVQQLALTPKSLRAQRHPGGLTLFQQPLAVALVGDDAAPGCQAILHALQGGDATRVQTLARAGGQQPGNAEVTKPILPWRSSASQYSASSRSHSLRSPVNAAG